MPADRPRVLFIANGVLGWNTYSRTMAAALQARDDLDLRVLWRRPGGLSTLLVKRHSTNPLARLLRQRDPFDAYAGILGREIRAAITRERPDVVHFASHWPAGALTPLPDRPAFTAATDATRANLNAMWGQSIWTPRQIDAEARVLRGAAHLFPMSRWNGRSLRHDLGCAPDRVTVMPPQVDMAAFRPPRAGNGVANIVFIGNDFRRKGGERLMRWVTGPLAGLCHLHIVSADPAAKVAHPGVTAHGKVAHARLVGALLPRMDLICLPTEQDMSPNVLAEAAAAGLPAVASNVGGIGELVRHGETGFVAPAGEDAAFLAYLRRLVGDAPLRQSMSRATLAFAADRLNARRGADRLAEVFHRVAAGARVAA